MADRKRLKVTQAPLPTNSKANDEIPQKKTGQTISISGLFDQQTKLKQRAAKGTNDIFAPSPAGIFKQYASPHHSRSAENPVLRRFMGATNAYRNSFGKGNVHQLDDVYKELVTHVDHLAVLDGSIKIGDSANTVVEPLAEEYKRLANPLKEDKIEMQHTKADRTIVSEERLLGDTMKHFKRILEGKQDEMTGLLRELEAVDAEIAAVKENILLVEQREGSKLKRALDDQVASLLQKAEACNKSTHTHVAKARKQDKAASKDQQEKFDKFMESIT